MESMRIDTGIMRGRPMVTQPPARLEYAEPNPHLAWMAVLSAGAAFAAGAMLVSVVWNVLFLGARVRQFPQPQVIRSWWPFVTLAEVAFTWVAVWILTSDNPSPQRTRRLRANVLRLLVTVLFLMLSAQVLRLIDGFGWRPRSSWPWLSTQLVDLCVTLLFWPHLCWLAVGLELHGLAWRAMAAMAAQVASWTAYTGPWLLLQTTGKRVLTDRYFQNLIFGLVVLCSTIATLVLIRFAFTFRAESQRADF
jgi:hypothetical protein